MSAHEVLQGACIEAHDRDYWQDFNRTHALAFDECRDEVCAERRDALRLMTGASGNDVLPCGFVYVLHKIRCQKGPDHEVHLVGSSALGYHAYDPLERRKAERRRAARQPSTVDVEALDRAMALIELGENRASSADGPVGHFRDELDDREWRRLWQALSKVRAALSESQP